MRANIRVNELGEVEKRCTKCGEWLPADNEFFFYEKKPVLNSWCKACMLEYRKYKGNTRYKEPNGVFLFAEAIERLK